MKYSVFSILLAVLFVWPAWAQKIPDKPLSQWGKEESLRIVNESPWAKSYQSTAAASAAEAAAIGREQQQSRILGAPESYRTERTFAAPPIRVRLHSGLPLRQAMVRLQQLDAGYDKMSDVEKAAFDASKKGYLDCGICRDHYVITIYKDRDASRTAAEEGVFQGMSFDDLKGQVRLENSRGEMREIIQFNAPRGPSDPAVLYFKRSDGDGKRLIDPEVKSFRIVFSSDFRSAKNRFAILIPNTLDFRVDKLMIGEKLMF